MEEEKKKQKPFSGDGQVKHIPPANNSPKFQLLLDNISKWLKWIIPMISVVVTLNSALNLFVCKCP